MLNLAPSPQLESLVAAAVTPGATDFVRQELNGDVKAEIVDPVTPGAPVIFNPRITVSESTGLVVTQFRDQSGKVESQYPSDQVIRAYAAQEHSAALEQASTALPAPQGAVTAQSPTPDNRKASEQAANVVSLAV